VQSRYDALGEIARPIRIVVVEEREFVAHWRPLRDRAPHRCPDLLARRGRRDVDLRRGSQRVRSLHEAGHPDDWRQAIPTSASLPLSDQLALGDPLSEPTLQRPAIRHPRPAMKFRDGKPGRADEEAEDGGAIF
jgi:hypothetical protein